MRYLGTPKIVALGGLDGLEREMALAQQVPLETHRATDMLAVKLRQEL
jgi:hypothetical protein